MNQSIKKGAKVVSRRSPAHTDSIIKDVFTAPLTSTDFRKEYYQKMDDINSKNQVAISKRMQLIEVEKSLNASIRLKERLEERIEGLQEKYQQIDGDITEEEFLTSSNVIDTKNLVFISAPCQGISTITRTK